MPLWLAWSDPPLDQTPIYSPPTSRPPCIQITAPCTYAPQPRRYCRSQSGNRHHGLQQTCSVPGKHKMRYSQNERYYAYTWPLDPATPCFLFSSVLSYGTRPLIIQITVPSNYRASRLTCLPNYPSCAAHPFQDYQRRTLFPDALRRSDTPLADPFPMLATHAARRQPAAVAVAASGQSGRVSPSFK